MLTKYEDKSCTSDGPQQKAFLLYLCSLEEASQWLENCKRHENQLCSDLRLSEIS